MSWWRKIHSSRLEQAQRANKKLLPNYKFPKTSDSWTAFVEASSAETVMKTILPEENKDAEMLTQCLDAQAILFGTYCGHMNSGGEMSLYFELEVRDNECGRLT